jgi:hypothetical protein
MSNDKRWQDMTPDEQAVAIRQIGRAVNGLQFRVQDLEDAVKHRRSTLRISSAIAGWPLVKTRSGSLPGEGNLPIETMTALNAKKAKAPALTVPLSMVLRADEVIE